jgi:hypothetical protein
LGIANVEMRHSGISFDIKTTMDVIPNVGHIVPVTVMVIAEFRTCLRPVAFFEFFRATARAQLVATNLTFA